VTHNTASEGYSFYGYDRYNAEYKPE
jgi:hypothetical protein